TLLALSKLEGVYVPCLYRTDEDSPNKAPEPIQEGVPARIRARTIPRLKPENYPESPLVPLIQVTHDRLSLEIMRGCSRNCRFCNAGMVYRPVRTRSVDDLIRQADKAVASTGYEEISLLSLSTSDYPDLPELLRRLQDRFSEKGISISFPSLRPDTFTPEMADLSAGLRKSGLTLAPEAGTQRLRDVINKNNTETDLLNAVQTAFERGWKRIKLYFMIGLPTETDEDLEGIVSLVGKLVACSRQFGRREISLSLSPFSPKPHTPFQWEAQDSVPVLEEKIGFLKKRIRWPEVQVHWRDPHVSRLETALGRGDRTLGKAVRIAWEKGARFDAWSDQLDLSKWESAFRDAGTKTEVFTSSMRPMDPLPWGHLSKGVPDAFLLRERDKAVRMEPTPDCRTVSCAGCGLESHPVCRPRKGAGNPVSTSVSASETGTSVKKTRRVFFPPVVFRVRCEYAKGPEARFCSHLDTVRMFIRSLRRANVAVAYSKGFHAHPLLSFGPPLPLGFTSRFEYVDIDFLEHVPKQFDALLNRHLPSGFEVKQTALIPARIPSLDSSINLAHYRVDAEGGFDQAGILGAADRFLKLNTYKVKRGEKEVDIRLQVDRIAWKSGGLDLALRIGLGGSARPDEVLQALLPKDEDPPRLIRYERTHLFVEKQG
ncbi:MAG TPA: TIGR03936 family radical SAM-associated protein, partial [bacterium]